MPSLLPLLASQHKCTASDVQWLSKTYLHASIFSILIGNLQLDGLIHRSLFCLLVRPLLLLCLVLVDGTSSQEQRGKAFGLMLLLREKRNITIKLCSITYNVKVEHLH